MKTFIWIINILNLIVVISFLFYFPIIYLHYTFTSDDLPDDNVPFYISDNPANPTEKDSGRFGVYWWVYATDTLRFLFILLPYINLLAIRSGEFGFEILATVLLILLVIWELAKFIWAIILWEGSNCQLHQFCRNFGSRRDGFGIEIGANPRNQNFVYTFMTWYNLAFFLIGILYLALLGGMSGSLFKWLRVKNYFLKFKEKEQFFIPTIKSVKSWIIWTSVALSSILVLVMIFYFPLIFQNFTFTFNDLPDGNIPFYINNKLLDITEEDSGRLELYWWIYATDTLLILVPVAVLGTIALIIYRADVYKEVGKDKSGKTLYKRVGEDEYHILTIITQIFILILFIWQIVKFVWAAILSLPSLCDDHQFCRPFCSRRGLNMEGKFEEQGCNARNLNFAYSSLVWFNLVFCFLLLFQFLVTSSMEGALFKNFFKRLNILRKDEEQPQPQPRRYEPLVPGQERYEPLVPLESIIKSKRNIKRKK